MYPDLFRRQGKGRSKKLLVHVDNFEHTNEILSNVPYLAKALTAEVILFHSCHGEIPEVEEFAPAGPETASAVEKLRHEDLLARAANCLIDQGLTVNWVCEKDLPPGEAIAYAQKHACILYWPQPYLGVWQLKTQFP